MIIPWMSLPTLACSPVGSGPCSSVIGNHSYQDYLLSTLEVAETSGNYDEYIKNNAWVTVNNDFLVTSHEVICQWFSLVTKSRVKIIGKSRHEWPKIIIHGNECIILFLTQYFMPWTHNPHKTIIDHSFCHCRQGRIFWFSIVTSSQLICDVMPTRVTSIVTSSSSIVHAHANWHKGDLH